MVGGVFSIKHLLKNIKDFYKSSNNCIKYSTSKKETIQCHIMKTDTNHQLLTLFTTFLMMSEFSQ